ncbi:biopolymer transport protein exbD2 [Oleiphilus messinensis]|uniref:Biopolymer transport protein exbD2 n=1 Tax=Oleiphilus messinensis TaxID=141451 RepID=A0A1Y0I8X2_9GAMM|nr:biopolymer transporter ExbD [Oleiphilus messinensis]ARU56948.1 biopolymer transport protein exbD2 [Oleiphilus messinensis]
MRRFSWQNQSTEDDSGIDVTPMLDVVFILLIFFVVTATFVKESGIDVNRPVASTGVAQESAAILVGIRENDEVWIDGHLVEIYSVRPLIQRLSSENPQGSVVIQADKNARTEVLIQVMDAAREAGVENVAIATESY